MIKLLRGWLRAGIFEGGVVSQVEAGTPQGSPVSPLLANIALHVLDLAWERDGQRSGRLVRYCDDFVVLCPTTARAEQARALAGPRWGRSGCICTRTRPGSRGSARGVRASISSGFHHRMVESRKRRGRYWMTSGRRHGRWPPSGPRFAT